MPTIAAIATPPGQGGIAVVRISGPGAKTLLSRIFLPRSSNFLNFRPWTMHRGALLDANDEPLDDVLAVYMPGPRTYTGEDMAEIHCHGGRIIPLAVLDSLLRLGARLAGPGEFTRRAYLNNRMDLTQAEAVAEIISAASREAARDGLERLEGRLASLVEALAGELDELRALARVGADFADDEVDALSDEEFLNRTKKLVAGIDDILAGAGRARLMSQGARVVLAGCVNAGKSSIFNQLCGQNRAIVTEIAGTTRDYLEASLSFQDLPVVLVDTAGLREEAGDAVERMGIARSREMLDRADLVCLVLDGADVLGQKQVLEASRILENRAEIPVLAIWNKTDLAPLPEKIPDFLAGVPICPVDALHGDNINSLELRIRDLLLRDCGAQPMDQHTPPNLRQAKALEDAREELRNLCLDLENGLPLDCCLTRLDMASGHLGAILSLASEDELLDKIFSSFCIGK